MKRQNKPSYEWYTWNLIGAVLRPALQRESVGELLTRNACDARRERWRIAGEEPEGSGTAI